MTDINIAYKPLITLEHKIKSTSLDNLCLHNINNNCIKCKKNDKIVALTNDQGSVSICKRCNIKIYPVLTCSCHKNMKLFDYIY